VSGGRPVLLTVDDDASVSRAVARDLRRRYGESYRVVRAESGPDALDAVKEFVLRGEEVALLLADHRMPGMTGVEFLELAMDVVPDAKRVLLTAYADTDAAIRAINDVDLDRYLLKPWDPPEERLYPVLDELLASWGTRSRPSFTGITLLGHQWSAETQAAKEFLARNQVPYRHLEVTDPAAARLLTAAGLTADVALPVVLLPEGEVLHRPSLRELAARAGLTTEAGSPFYDLVVVGGGPAGLGAAVYGASEGLRTLLVERAATGGQAGQSSRIENYLGFPKGLSGAELAQRARDQALRFGVEVVTASEVTGIEPQGDGRVVHLDGARASPPTPSCWPPASATRACRRRRSTPSRAGASTTARDARGGELHRPGRLRRGARQQRRAGGAVLPAVRGQGRARRPRRRPAAQHERVPRRAHRGRPQDRGPHLHRGRRRRRRRAPRAARPARQRAGHRRAGRRRLAVRLHRRGPAHRLARRPLREGRQGVRPHRPRAARRRRPPAGRLAPRTGPLPARVERAGGVRRR
jgi:CheY-like chemotaxis protein